MKYQVKSSVFSKLEYIPPEMKLVIKFNSGSVYEYFNVPRTILSELLESESKGRYFIDNIRNSFKFTQKF